MDELAKAVRHFIARDVIYIIGGGTVILSIAYSLDIDFEGKSYPVAIFWFGAGVAYLVGYAIQELSSVIKIITTRKVRKLWSSFEYCYNRFADSPWVDLESADLEDASSTVDCHGNERQIAKLERTITLKQVAATTGACGLVSAIVIGIHVVVDYSGRDLVIALSVLAFSAVGILMCWVKGGQQQQQTFALSNWLKANPPD